MQGYRSTKSGYSRIMTAGFVWKRCSASLHFRREKQKNTGWFMTERKRMLLSCQTNISSVCLSVVKRQGNPLLWTGRSTDTFPSRSRRSCCLTEWGMCFFRHYCLMMWSMREISYVPISTQSIVSMKSGNLWT